MNIHFILVEPSQAGNVGASARAIKTMGFQHLHVVGDIDLNDELCRKMAYGSHDILDQASQHATLAEAIEPMDLVVGTTAKRRTGYQDFFSPEETRKLVDAKAIDHVAIVFGREDRGLEGHEIEQCDLLSTIDLAADYPSINLSQSLMVYAYVFGQIRNDAPKAPPQPSTQRTLKNKALEMLDTLKISEKKALHRRIMERLMQINEDDTHLFLTFHRYLAQKLRKLQ